MEGLSLVEFGIGLSIIFFMLAAGLSLFVGSVALIKFLILRDPKIVEIIELSSKQHNESQALIAELKEYKQNISNIQEQVGYIQSQI